MLIVALFIAGLFALYLLMRMMIERSNAQMREEFRLAMDSLMVHQDAQRVPNAQNDAAPAAKCQDGAIAIAAATAAATARQIHVRPANPQPVITGQDIWAQHGRAGVWSSHDIAQRWR